MWTSPKSVPRQYSVTREILTLWDEIVETSKTILYLCDEESCLSSSQCAFKQSRLC